MIKIALNGGMPKSENPNVPTALEEYVGEIEYFTSQGMNNFHIHFRDEQGMDSLEQSVIQPQIEELKHLFPNINIGIGSPLLYGRTHEKRMAQIAAWKDFKPDYISVNVPEEGCQELVALLREKEIPMEISCFTMDDAIAYAKNQYVDDTFRVLIEVSGEKDAQASIDKAMNIYKYLHDRYPQVEYVIHGEDIYTWEVIAHVRKLGLNWRIGMEDVATDREGKPIGSNRELYEYALSIKEE